MTKPKSLRSLSKEMLLDRSGQGLTEYLILLILVAVVCIGGVTSLGKAIDGRLDEARKKINSISVNPTSDSSR